MMYLKLTEPMGDLGLPENLQLGPFKSVLYEDGYFYDQDGKRIAEIFRETMNDMMATLGHPGAGMIYIPRTFEAFESDDPDYPGKPYSKVEIISEEAR